MHKATKIERSDAKHLTIHTPDRKYLLRSSEIKELDSWHTLVVAFSSNMKNVSIENNSQNNNNNRPTIPNKKPPPKPISSAYPIISNVSGQQPLNPNFISNEEDDPPKNIYPVLDNKPKPMIKNSDSSSSYFSQDLKTQENAFYLNAYLWMWRLDKKQRLQILMGVENVQNNILSVFGGQRHRIKGEIH